ncbi:MAG: hypothetical protein IPH94_13015 [Saprospiraceae bacterium]|nr:hypothetical protein [Saprospiraceae bacterium]
MLADQVTEEELSHGTLYPRMTHLQEISLRNCHLRGHLFMGQGVGKSRETCKISRHLLLRCKYDPE